MIKDIVQDGVNKISQNEKINLLETIALSLFIGTGDINRYHGQDLFRKLSSSIEYTNYRNFNTILSNDGRSFVVGETVPYEISYPSGNIKRGVIILNIESICLPATETIDGETPIEILYEFSEIDLINALSNTFDSKIPSKIIKAINKSDFVHKMNERIKLEESDLIFYSDDTVVIIPRNNDIQNIKIIYKFGTNDYTIEDTKSIDIIEDILGDN